MSAPRFADIRAPCQAALRATLFDRAARPPVTPFGRGGRLRRPSLLERPQSADQARNRKTALTENQPRFLFS